MNNFTPRAQQVLALARKEADRFNHNFVGTEHLLLGLIKLGQGVAVNVLQKMGLDLETVRMEVEKQVGTGPDQKMIGNIPYTPRVKKVLALASKEILVLAGKFVMAEARKSQVRLLPVDSEHNAVFQCLEGHPRAGVRRIFLTASGGAFRDWPEERLAQVKPADALKHPNWAMGPKKP